jgi:CubicO group peptidase (beta-lactamase class C family)
MKMLLITICCISTLTICAQTSKAQSADKRFDGLDAQFNQILKDWHAAGFAVAVVEKDKIIYSKGFGYRDIEKKLPVTPNTLFAIGSVTKSFTSSLIGMLSAEGKLDIDKPAHTYFSNLSFYNDNMNNAITLRHMMSHQTGLPRHDYSWYFFSTNSRDSMVQRIRYQEPTAGVREKWQYNNFMFTAQGWIAEKITNKSWEQNIKEKIFTPLNMTRSNFSTAELGKIEDASFGYTLLKDSIIKKMNYYNIDAMGPAGSINSSANEMANWLITWIYGGKFKGKEIIPFQHAAEAITPQAITGGGLPSKEKPDIYFSTYGFGWMMSSYRGHYRVEHGGNIDGFSASASFFPTDSIGIVVLSNQNGSAVPGIVRNIISDRLLKLTPYNWNADQKKAVETAKAKQKETSRSATAKDRKNTKPTHPLNDYEGTYSQPGYGIINVFANNDSLFARISDKLLWLMHDNYNVFDYFLITPGEPIDTAGSGPSRIQFHMNKAGDIDQLTVDMQTGLQPIVFKKQINTIEVRSNELQKYVGEYELSGMTVKVYIKNDNTLFVFVPGQPEYELLPTEKNKFAFKALSGYFLQFTVTDGDKVTDLTFIQPNGDFKAVKK